MLDACNPCFMPENEPCEHCYFSSYAPIETRHRDMKELILKVINGEEPIYAWMARKYMELHPNWEKEMEEE